MAIQAEYNEAQIKVLEGLEAVRMRPGMYIGSTAARGLHHLVEEIVDNAIDEALAGHCTAILVALEDDDVVRVEDNGRGIPTGLHPDLKIPTPEVVFTKLHAGGKFGTGSYKVSGGLHGVGASVVNALSAWLEVTIHRDGKIHQQRYERGQPATKLKVIGASAAQGTIVRFRPDLTIFPKTRFSLETILGRLRELAYLNPGLSIRLVDEREDFDRLEVAPVSDADDIGLTATDEGADGGAADAAEAPPVDAPAAEGFDQTFHYPGGLADFVKYLNEDQDVLHAPFTFRGETNGVEVEVALQYNDGYGEVVTSFCNCIRTGEGGTHETGFKAAHTRLMNEYARRAGLWKKKDNLTGSDLREGVMALVHVRMQGVEFEGQTKTRLGNPEARSAVEELTARHFGAWLDEHPEFGRAIVDKAARAQEAREAAQKAKKAVQTGKSQKTRTSLEGKLTRCSSKKAELNELFIVEGDSAGGSAKQGRDREHQAILPIKGKPLNTERATLAKVLSNREILSVVQAVGAGIGPEFDLDEANYARVIILADADDDGAHIRCLLLTFFYRFMKPLLAAGAVYIAQPPLYRLERSARGKTSSEYLWSDAELQAALARGGRGKDGRGVTIQRFKGLGEMNPGQLWETTMNPETRTLVRVSVEDAAAAEKQVHLLMGSKAEPRKLWISSHVHFGEDAVVPVADAGVAAGMTPGAAAADAPTA
ncbi:MAG: DNA gyrase subunit B [Deltaproteobacteria bacterium]|nr:DNA gyrase subunit B [Deltaproteobacteria bacterium]